jgi:hypothetical protein
MTAHEVSMLRLLMPKVALFITQPVRGDYRDMPMGSDQLAELLPDGAEQIQFPVAYFSGLFPFQVYVNLGQDPIAFSAPLTDYHDLRILWAASRGWDARETARRITTMRLDPAWVKRNAQESLAELEHREALLTRPAALLSPVVKEHPVGSFHTVNHPSNQVLRHTAEQVAELVGVDPAGIESPKREMLGHLAAPREAAVATLFGEPLGTCWPEWRTPAGSFTLTQVAAAHLELYDQHGDVLAAGLIKHNARLHELRDMYR